ncbi:hypothetical protein SynSYN20_00714 [Synechococcus sp. SYN20]|nr:hypothetical protein SynSYN20_00714 [Synechococcus sp. SYN20]
MAFLSPITQAWTVLWHYSLSAYHPAIDAYILLIKFMVDNFLL